MSHHESIGQLALFPELFKSPDLPSISTLPEFDKALDNMIRMNDLGAFISINVHGLDKSYSVHIRELEIPQEFLKTGHSEAVSTVYYLFPAHIRHQLRKLTYDVRSFLNSKNSFKTSFGYFLFRPYFRIWEKYVDEQKSRIEQFLSHTLKGREYGKHFLSAFDHGYRFLEDAGDDTAPWDFHRKLRLSHIQEAQKEIRERNLTLHSLDKTVPDYPLMAIALKTIQFPADLKTFLKQFTIQFAFKTIHLDYLKEVDITSIEDVKQLSDRLTDET
ncbi:MAG: hypothetical protein QGG85_08835 [Candidatus Marinimicrobia bacterium]|jgi:hypothetical protein|nr:hypothetical protein [Candidatus Neomarinimicrobiota bacterium]MDP7059257.1 hypothetical protein [Candidatus Neomarinimicrobiota bacterium]|tara:strand:+ start:1827 stop:2645 length:819 start_codon:yes stop_codon:yes gene_type:complete